MTTSPLTPAELPALRALYEKATPGPWKQHLVDDTCVIDHHGNTVAETFPDGGKDDDIDYNTNAEQKELDAAFIAAARDALPRALDTIEAQAAGLAERDAEIARLREALTPFTTLSDRTVAMCVVCGTIGDSLMMLDFRRARGALAKEPQT